MWHHPSPETWDAEGTAVVRTWAPRPAPCHLIHGPGPVGLGSDPEGGTSLPGPSGCQLHFPLKRNFKSPGGF